MGKMKMLVVAPLVFSAIVRGLVIPDVEQFPLLDDKFADAVKSNAKNYSKIAIIGSGITGAATAFKLAESYRRRAPPNEQPVITVFERNEIVGGRITQAYAYNDSRYPVDTCAATFASSDRCIAQATLEVGLGLLPVTNSDPRGSGIGVWNGEKFVGYVEDDAFRELSQWSFFRQMKYFERYGLVPWVSSQEATRQRLAFSQLLNSPFNSNLQVAGQANLSKSVENLKLQDYVQNFLCAGAVFFPSGRKGGLFLDEVLTAAQRERYFGSVFDLNVLEFLFGFEERQERSIRGGNLKLIDRLLRLATNEVRLGTEVRKLERQLTGDVKLTYESNTDEATVEETFDAVIIATSLDRSNLGFNPPLEDVLGLRQKYKDSFVTHFTTSALLNGSYFNWEDTMPQTVYTTISIEDFFDGKEEPLFFSLQLLKQLRNPRDGNPQDYLFKLVSRKEVSDSEIEKMLREPNRAGDKKINWIDRRPLPQSIPVTAAAADECKVLLERIEIAPNVYYAGAGEQVIGGAEFGCRMGVNVANLILDGEALQR